MLIYRLEHRTNGHGPYCYINRAARDLLEKPHRNMVTHPTSIIDFDVWSGDYLHRCETLEALEAWFGEYWKGSWVLVSLFKSIMSLTIT